MLFKQRFLDGIAAGAITLAFRRWTRPSVRAGGELRTAIGVLAIEAVDSIAESDLSERDARRAGYASLDELRAELRQRSRGRLYRIRLRHAGKDPRIALRERAAITPDELHALETRLARLDAASRRGPWTLTILLTIAERPRIRAADLAESMGREVRLFKADVRKLKELGLTESLEVGYRLSPRGRSLLARKKKRAR